VPGARISWGLIFAEWWWAFVLLTSWVLVGNLRPGFGAGVDGFGRFGPAACVCVHRIVPPVRGRSVIGRSALELGRILCGVDFASPPVREAPKQRAGSRDRDRDRDLWLWARGWWRGLSRSRPWGFGNFAGVMV
jgi:hypothetical protein